MKLNYDYSTKNYHRFAAPTSTGLEPKEIYISKAAMQKPVNAVDVQVTIADGTFAVEKSKPPRA